MCKLFYFLNYLFNKARNNLLQNGHFKSFSDRMSDQLNKCDQEIRKMFADCQNLIDEEHDEADFYYKKFNWFTCFKF